MNYKKVNKYVTDDGEIFGTKKEAQRHCDKDVLSHEFQSIWLNRLLDFDDLMENYTIKDIQEASDLLTKILKFKLGDNKTDPGR